MQRQGLNPDIYTYAPLVGALGGAGRVEEAMQVCMHRVHASRIYN